MMQRGHRSIKMMNPLLGDRAIAATGIRLPHHGTTCVTIMQQHYRPTSCLRSSPQSSKPDGNLTGPSASHMGGNSARRVLPRSPPRSVLYLNSPLPWLVIVFSECARIVHPVNACGNLIKTTWTCLKFSRLLRRWARNKLARCICGV